jgi:predicted Zn-dependent protease
MNDLKRLHELKHNFEMLFIDNTTVSLPVDEKPKSDNSDVAQKIAEITKEISPLDTPLPAPRRRKKEQPVDHNILDEIKTSKEEIALETERQKQQIELIDQFIKAQPSISANSVKEKPVSVPPTDLNSIKSGEFSDNIISETLVEILLKQGKKERAIEVLKKLIWKYPQKKAYFASRIEDLKK